MNRAMTATGDVMADLLPLLPRTHARRSEYKDVFNTSYGTCQAGPERCRSADIAWQRCRQYPACRRRQARSSSSGCRAADAAQQTSTVPFEPRDRARGGRQYCSVGMASAGKAWVPSSPIRWNRSSVRRTHHPESVVELWCYPAGRRAVTRPDPAHQRISRRWVWLVLCIRSAPPRTAVTHWPWSRPIFRPAWGPAVEPLLSGSADTETHMRCGQRLELYALHRLPWPGLAWRLALGAAVEFMYTVRRPPATVKAASPLKWSCSTIAPAVQFSVTFLVLPGSRCRGIENEISHEHKRLDPL